MRLEKVLLGGGNPVLEVVGRSGHRLVSWILALMKAGVLEAGRGEDSSEEGGHRGAAGRQGQ